LKSKHKPVEYQNGFLSFNATNLVPRVLRLLGQWVVAGRDPGVMEKYDFFDWLFPCNKTKNFGGKKCRISVVKIPVPQSLSRNRPLTKKPATKTTKEKER